MRPFLIQPELIMGLLCAGGTSEQAKQGPCPHAIDFPFGVGKGDNKQEQQKDI